MPLFGTATITLQTDVENLTPGKIINDLVATLASAIGEQLPLVYNGNTTVTVPAGSTYAIIVNDPTNTATIKFISAGDTNGTALLKTGWSVIALDPSVATFILNSTATAYTTVVFL